ncbi:MAG: M3 family oligoendopeptidase [Fimbriimonas ginsengisoli]|uniref:M3 family oligoendopeptidase n=1 Tax=Fimbriimonas ginsengisoli TaxID=1005039 RepID=A0A931LU28_FIMGI|nr:M3 family oligoendopeptidase [Fimbriimonas ginsengisoli]
MATATALPRWDLTPFFPSIESPEFHEAFASFGRDIGRLEAIVAEHRLGRDAPLDRALFDQVIGLLNAVLEQRTLFQAYLSAHTTTDATDVVAQAKESELDGLHTRFQKVRARLTAWIGSIDEKALLGSTPRARDHSYFIEKCQVGARHQMSPAEEELAAELQPIAGAAWEKLYGNVSSLIQTTVPLPEGDRVLPMSAIRNLAYEADRRIRQVAFETELATWKANEVPLAAALNSIKGQVGTLNRRRGWESPLDEALFQANIDRATLDAMLGAARDAFPDFRRYLKAKARALGVGRLAFFDLFAPVGDSARQWPYEEAERFVEMNFATFSDKLADSARRAFRERWIDAEARTGKRDGAYCAPYPKGISRVMMNFRPSFGSVKTLAHELGHAYHNLCLGERTAIQQDIPMTLAETASIFCETIMKRAALKAMPEGERITLLEASLQSECQVVVDITSRFIFESGVFEGRIERELSAAELCGLMRNAQLDTYGDALDPERLHPYMWAAKPHYYASEESFYNFPYMFGLLFGLGLYGLYEAEPAGFHERYDELLSTSGMADAATLAASVGIDIRSKAFWARGLATIRDEIDQFEVLVGR